MTPREKGAILQLLYDARVFADTRRPWDSLRCLNQAIILMHKAEPLAEGLR